MAVVERLALHRQAQADPGDFGVAIPGHAADHRGLYQSVEGEGIADSTDGE
jgi:hypothetical protein